MSTTMGQAPSFDPLVFDDEEAMLAPGDFSR